MASRTLALVLKGDATSLSRTMRKAQGDVNSFGQRVQRTAKIAAAAVGALGIALARASVTGAVELEKGLSEVRTLLPDLTNQGFGQLRKEVLALSSEMGIATQDAVPALYAAISAGVPPDNVMEFLRTASKTAIGGVTDLSTATDALTTVLNTWGKTAGVTATQAADVLFTSVKLGKTTMEELGGSINQVAGIASSFGIEFEQVSAAFTEVTKAGVPTAEAMTKVRSLIQSISAPSTEAANTFKQLGIEVSAARTAQEGMLPVIQEIMAATAGNDVLQRKLFGSVEALQAALVLTSGSGEGFSATLDAMRDSTGAADAAFGTMNETLAREWETTRVRFMNGLTALGTRVLPAVTAALGKLVQMGEWLAENWSKLAPIFAGVGAALAALLVLQVAQWIMAIVAAVKALNLAMLTGPGAILVGIGLLTAALVLLWQRSETFRDVVTAVFNAVRQVVAMVVDAILGYIQLWLTGIDKVAGAVSWLADKIGIDMSAITDATSAAVDFIASARDRLVPAISGVGEASEDTAVQVQAATASMSTAFQDTADSFYEGAANIDASLGRVTESVVVNADAQRRALESHYQGLEELRREAGRRKLLHQQQLNEAVFQVDADAARRQFVFASQGLSEAERFLYNHRQANFTTHQAIAASSKVATTRQLSEAARLTAGLRVEMRNACGTVTGFKQCVDGVVVEFDTAGNRILDTAEQLADGLAVPITNACGTVTGFKQCVDGVVVEFDASMERIADSAQGMTTGVGAAAREFDASMELIAGKAQNMSTRVGAAMSQARGSTSQLNALLGAPQARQTAGEVTRADTMRRDLQVLTAAQDATERFRQQLAALQQAGAADTRVAAVQRRLDQTQRTVDRFTSAPQMAAGGIVRSPTLVWAGERGPEAILPLSQMPSTRATVELNVNVTVEGSVVSEGDLGEFVLEQVNAGLRRGDVEV